MPPFLQAHPARSCVTGRVRWRRAAGPLIAFAAAATATSSLAEEPPYIQARPFAPGGIAIDWEHPSDGAGSILLEREGGFSREFYELVGSFTDLGLQPATTYRYRACSIYAQSRECSPWIVGTTLAPTVAAGPRPVPVFSGSTRTTNEISVHWTASQSYSSYQVRWALNGLPDRQVKVKGGTGGSFTASGLRPNSHYHFIIQGCTWSWLGLGCSRFSAPLVVVTSALGATAPPDAPAIATSALAADRVRLSWAVPEGQFITNVRIERDGRLLKQEPALAAFDDTVRPNTRYAYRVCFANSQGMTCADAAQVAGRPTPPSIPMSPRVRIIDLLGGGGGGLPPIRIMGKEAVLSWTHAPGDAFIPADSFHIEREGRAQVGPTQIGTVWRDIGEVSGHDNPTMHNAALRRELGFTAGSRYRVCAVIVSLGETGRSCSVPVVGSSFQP
jgi:hypothetical protein